MRFPWQRPEPIPAKQVIEEFITVLLELHPEAEIKSYNEGGVDFGLPSSPNCAIMIHKIHAALEFENHPKLKKRRKIYSDFIEEMFRNSFGKDEEEITPADQDRVLPRIIHQEFLDFAAERSKELIFPHRPFYNTGLFIAYVLDSERSVSYVTDKQAQELELDEAGLYAKSLENARAAYQRNSLRERYVANENFNVEFCEDGHNSARLIVLPEYLEPGEELAVLLPDKEVIIVAAVPTDNNWNPLRSVARKGNPSFVEHPMLVTAEGVRMM